MIFLLWFLVFFGGFFITATLLLRWLGGVVSDAHKYRTGQGQRQRQPAIPEAPQEPRGKRWKISYTDKGKMHEVVIPADTEAEAIKQLVKQYHAAYRNIVSSEPA